MGYLKFEIKGEAGTGIGIRKYFLNSSEETQADDRYTVVTPAGQLLDVDEADTGDASAWVAAGMSFSTSGNEVGVITLAGLVTGFPSTTNTSLYADITTTTTIAGSGVTFGDGVYAVTYNNDSEDSNFRIHLHLPTILDAIDTLADRVINCQCNCIVDEMDAQKYIKARAYLDLIVYKAEEATSNADHAALQLMVTTLTNFLAGTDELCGSC
jgi:hypothetical protein